MMDELVNKTTQLCLEAAIRWDLNRIDGWGWAEQEIAEILRVSFERVKSLLENRDDGR